MKGRVASVLIFLSAVSASFAAVGFGRATVHDSHPDQCYNAKDNSYYSPGQSWPMEGCGQITCEKYSAGQLMVSFMSCGKAMVQPPCYLVQDNSKPYPDCCHQVVCPESNSDELFAISEEDDGFISVNNNRSAPAAAAPPAPSVNDLSAVRCCKEEDDNMVSRDERNDLQSLEDADDKLNEEESFEIIQPKLLPPTFQYATFDDDIGNDHEQRLNEVDTHEDYQLV